LSLFIVFEGGDGSGKTTQAKALYKRLHDNKRDVIYTQEPGGTFLGHILRIWLTDPKSGLLLREKTPLQLPLTEPSTGDELVRRILSQSTAPRAELSLFLIARSQLVDEVIRPSLSKGSIVICDRYAPSSVAYQGYGRGLDLRLIQVANEVATQGLQPDLIILLDVAPETGLPRKWAAAGKDYFENSEVAFHRRVREGYLKMAAAEPERWLVVDATLPQKEVEGLIWERVKQLLPKA
jgi:dTMP kinase